MAHFSKMSYKRYTKLVKHFKTTENILKASFNDCKDLGFEETFLKDFFEWKESTDPQKLETRLHNDNIHAITIESQEYPVLLRQVYDPPLCLFIRGNILKEPLLPLAVVGTRKNSVYGKQITEKIVETLVKAQSTLVSGLALGIDGIVHETTLKNQGITYAVLGTGVDDAHIYPQIHFQLAQKIVTHGGALISEYPPGCKISGKYTFARRNRIIAGLCLGTVVIEAPQSSGSLITAQYALDSNREVFAVPQNITAPNSTGPHALLKMGAHLVTDANDILNVFGMSFLTEKIKNFHPETSLEQEIWNCLSHEPTAIDTVLQTIPGEKTQILSTLTLLEIKGMVKNLGGMQYIKIS